MMMRTMAIVMIMIVIMVVMMMMRNENEEISSPIFLQNFVPRARYYPYLLPRSIVPPHHQL